MKLLRSGKVNQSQKKNRLASPTDLKTIIWKKKKTRLVFLESTNRLIFTTSIINVFIFKTIIINVGNNYANISFSPNSNPGIPGDAAVHLLSKTKFEISL